MVTTPKFTTTKGTFPLRKRPDLAFLLTALIKEKRKPKRIANQRICVAIIINIA